MSGDRIAERIADILALARGTPRVDALAEADRVAWARGQAERELASVPYLPGGLSWSEIEATYRKLAASPAGSCARPPLHAHRRHNRAEPSRPEVAHKLDVSTATLDRACVQAGRGKHWPPRGL